MTRPRRWTSRLHWDDNDRTTHNGTTYELWAHGYPTGYARGQRTYSTRNAYHLHQVLPNGQTHPHPLSNPLSTNRRKARRLAELWILGWRPAPGTRSAEHDYRPMWRAPDATLHPIEDVLSGAVPH